MNGRTNQLIIGQPVIRLTPVQGGDGPGGDQLPLPAYELIAYSQAMEHTRLHLTGRRTLEVKETTQEIDRLVRDAHVGFGM